ncbi:MAG: transglutaminase domain-containing protein [Chloroflexi bacterium]|nr:transglutaminase domain-containing protein [Chloroflexota bacterium]
MKTLAPWRLWRDGWLLLLTTVVVLSPLWSIESARWVSGLPSLTGNALVAIFIGILFARLSFPKPLGAAVATLLGSFSILWQLRDFLDGSNWSERLTDLIIRTNAWGYAARSGGISTDNIAFILFVLSISWLVGYLAAWNALHRRNIWWAVIPSGVGVLVNLSYAPPSLGIFFLLYLIASVLLVVFHHFISAERTDHPVVSIEGPWRGLFGYLGGVGVVFVFVAWWLPLPGQVSSLWGVWQQVNSPWQQMESHFNRLFGALTGRDEPGASFFDQMLVLKGSTNLSNEPVMIVESTEPRYWRTISYDMYIGQGWVSTDQTVFNVRELHAVKEDYLLRKELTQTVTIVTPKNDLVFAAGQPLHFNLPVKVRARSSPTTINLDNQNPSEGLAPNVQPYVGKIQEILSNREVVGSDSSRIALTLNRLLPLNLRVLGVTKRGRSAVSSLQVAPLSPSDLGALNAFSPLKSGDRYTVVSSVSAAPPAMLRGAGTDYPTWVRDRYLQLPPTVPDRVKRLAAEITSGLENAYEKASALETYLRRFPYTTRIPPLPANTDGADYFLFTLKRGYCNNYATAMAVMLRSQGIPARLSSGYVTGDFDEAKGGWVVRETHAHTWVEVFFPKFGWVEFEPSSYRPLLTRPSELTDEALLEDLGIGEEEEGDLSSLGIEDETEKSLLSVILSEALRWGTVGIMALVLLSLFGWFLWRRYMAQFSPAYQIYEKLCLLASLCRLSPRPYQTPYEYARTLGDALPANRQSIEHITGAYVRVRFGGKTIDPSDNSRLREAWTVLRAALMRRLWQRR